MTARQTDETWADRRLRLMNRLHARMATWSRGATGFVSQPEPRTIGSFARGRQLVAGNYLFAGYLVEAPQTGLWDLPMPAPRFEAALHGFLWLDDLGAVSDAHARQRAQDWTWTWIARFGRGSGPGWSPDLTGRRLIRWISHAIFLLRGRDSDDSRSYFTSLGQQCRYLSRRWHTAQPGLPRFEALTGLIYAGLALTGMERLIDPAIRALAEECDLQIDAEGGLPTRNPEELLEVFTLLNWVAMALTEVGRTPTKSHMSAIERIAPTLRALRQADGGLARFHGGSRGLEGRLDHALATSGVRAAKRDGLSMGYARLGAGRVSIIVDAAPPPGSAASTNAHASTLAFEMTSGRRPLIVNCGSGASFGDAWHRAGRATPSHSTLGLDGYSSSRLGRGLHAQGSGRQHEQLFDRPNRVTARQSDDAEQLRLIASHDGYVASHGLTHVRDLALVRDGTALKGEDTLGALSEQDQGLFRRLIDKSGIHGFDFSVRFHIHPDVDAELDMGGMAVSLVLKSGEVWIFRLGDAGTLTLEPSVYLEPGRLKPRATSQIVISDTVTDLGRQIGWTLAKAQDTPQAIRDLAETGDTNTPIG